MKSTVKTAIITKVGMLNDPDEAKRGRIEVLEQPPMEVGDEYVRIKVAYCAICGSDPHTAAGIFGWEAPFGLGHEMSGVVVELGKNANKKGLKIGDRVGGNFLRFCGSCYYCKNGQEQFCPFGEDGNRPCFSESVVWHESQVFKLPDDVSLLEGCLMEPVSIALRTADKANVRPGQRVAICGGGPIGLLGLQMIVMRGGVDITLIEPIDYRRELAKNMGAMYVIDPARQDVYDEAMRITGGLGYDALIDASGSPRAAESLLPIAAKGATIVYAAQYPNEYELPLNLFKYIYEGEMTITGVYCSPYGFPRTAQVLSRMNLKDFTGNIYALDDIAEAFAAHLSGKYPKIIIKCNEDLE